MNTEVRTSAPGKLVILGEYVVLDGGPCLVAAVNRRAQVRLRPAAAADGAIEAWAPLQQTHRLQAGQPSGLDLVDDLRNTLGLSQVVFDATLDTSACFDQDSGEKLGVGSSAALAVALWAGLRILESPASGWFDAEPSLAELEPLRAGLQGGRGSGVDLVAALRGGLLEFQRQQDGASAAARAWPEGLLWTAVFTGRGAVTADYLARYEAWLATGYDSVQAVLDPLWALAETGCSACRAGDAAGLLAALDAYGAQMEVLGEAIDQPIVTPAHKRLATLARDLGGAYKPSGAGGGDVGIGCFMDPAGLLAFRHEAEALGLAAPELEIDPRGLIVEQQET